MKTKPVSLRFDENDLLLAVNKSGIKKSQKLIDFLLSEYVRDLKPQHLSLPKDYLKISEIPAIDQKGKVVVKDITSPQPKTTINTVRPKKYDYSKMPKKLSSFQQLIWKEKARNEQNNK